MSECATSMTLPVEETHVGQRADRVLTQLSGLSRARLQALMEAGRVTLNGKPTDNASHKVRAGEIYVVNVPPPEKAEPEAQDIPLTVVFEDDDVIVIDKPAGLVVHPAPGNRDQTLVNALLAHCGDTLSGIGGVVRPGIVHRLDKDTSGLIIVAKNDKAHQLLSAQFADRSLSRTYQALVWGSVSPPNGTFDAPIGRSKHDRKKMAVTARGKAAVTNYRVLKDYGVATLVECKLETGRTHQIRVHLAHATHPVVGDKTYGSVRAKRKIASARTAEQEKSKKAQVFLQQFPRQALHAMELRFIHPRTGKLRKFESKLPDDMLKLLKILK
jgi:23S rRNA pseudouridine1911/1915/1917 synthase